MLGDSLGSEKYGVTVPPVISWFSALFIFIISVLDFGWQQSGALFLPITSQLTGLF